MSDLKFGTSGLRGLVSDLTDDVCARYMAAFLTHMQKLHGLQKGAVILVGQDLRKSSPRIANAVIKAGMAAGFEIENCGALPTPALGLAAMERQCPAVMVTGSHIPEDRNGLKFYRADGEIDKADEAGILAVLQESAPLSDKPLPPISHAALLRYRERALSILPPEALKGMRIGVYQHSSVARDFLIDILTTLKADVVPLFRADDFIPVDTEALRKEDIEIAAKSVKAHRLDGLISTDGDADRPLVADETGRFIKGDLLGLLAAEFLGADAVATPVTSISIIEKSGRFQKVYRSKVGSPFVIAAMQEAKKDGFQTIVGFEANGGVLTGSAAKGLKALPTRDAILPILAALGLSSMRGVPLSALLKDLPQRFSASARLQNIAPQKAQAFLSALKEEKTAAAFLPPHNQNVTLDTIDGVRFVLNNGDVVHLRASGNAPELRCYAEADSLTHAEDLCAFALYQFQKMENKKW